MKKFLFKNCPTINNNLIIGELRAIGDKTQEFKMKYNRLFVLFNF